MFAIFALIVAFVLVKRALTFHDCEMTLMSPKYTKITEAPNHALYELYRYEDNNYNNEMAPEAAKVVVLFVAGNGGSYSQARSLGSTLLRNKPEAMMYTMDFKGEMSAFLPNAVERQQKYLEQVVNYLFKKHSCKIVLVGHSMGGYLTSRLNIPEMIEKRIVLSAPLKKLPIQKLFSGRDINNAPDLVSIGGSFWDVQVPTEFSKVEGSVQANEIAMSWSNPNHITIVWENGLLRAIVDYILYGLHENPQDFFLNTNLKIDALQEEADKPKDWRSLREDGEGVYQASQAIRILTNKKLGKDFEVESDCAFAQIVPGTSFPETVFKGKTKTIIPTLLTLITIPKGCSFRYYKKTDGYLRLDIHPRNEEYFRELSPFMDSLHAKHTAIKALKNIQIFDVSQINYERKFIGKVTQKSIRNLQYAIPWYCQGCCVHKVDVRAEKSLDNNDAIVIKSGNTFLRLFERRDSFILPASRKNEITLEMDKNFDEPVVFEIQVDFLHSVVEVLLKNHDSLVRGVAVGLSITAPYFLFILPFFVFKMRISELVAFALGLVLFSGIRPFKEIGKKLALSLLLPYPFAIIPIVLHTVCYNTYDLVYFLPFIYDIVAVVSVIRDFVEAKSYLPHLNYAYNLPLFFFFIRPGSTMHAISTVITGIAVGLKLHPTWIPILSALGNIVASYRTHLIHVK